MNLLKPGRFCLKPYLLNYDTNVAGNTQVQKDTKLLLEWRHCAQSHRERANTGVNGLFRQAIFIRKFFNRAISLIMIDIKHYLF